MRETLSTRNLEPSQLLIFYYTSTHARQPFRKISQERSVQGPLQGRSTGRTLEGEKRCNMRILGSPQVSHRQQTIPQEQIRRSIHSLQWHHVLISRCRICHLCSSSITQYGIHVWAYGCNILRCQCRRFIRAGGTSGISVQQVEVAHA
jgi:hypothetical protein